MGILHIVQGKKAKRGILGVAQAGLKGCGHSPEALFISPR